MEQGNHDLIEVSDLKKWFYPKQSLIARKKNPLRAVDGVSFSIKKGSSIGIAGESGCGKTTTGKLLLKLYEATEGSFKFDGVELNDHLSREQMRSFRRKAQLMFQNPFEALNPRYTIYKSLEEPLIIHDYGTKEERKSRIMEMLEQVHLTPVDSYLYKFPHQLSGGQLQRVVLARSLIVNPLFLVADEPVSMLDVSVRAGVLNLMRDITEKMQLTTVYISHDLSLIKYLCDETVIMYLGSIVEKGPTEEILMKPKHPYTKALISAVPSTDPTIELKELNLKDSITSADNIPRGCKFQDRCPYAKDICFHLEPQLEFAGTGHTVACHFAEEIGGMDK